MKPAVLGATGSVGSEVVVADSGLASTTARGPLAFMDRLRTGRYHAGPIRPESSPRICRANLAAFMLETATDGGFMQMKPLVSQ